MWRHKGKLTATAVGVGAVAAAVYVGGQQLVKDAETLQEDLQAHLMHQMAEENRYKGSPQRHTTQELLA